MSEEKQEVQQEQSLSSLLGEIPGSPSQEQIEKWKVEFGEVFVSGFSEEEMFVWRSLRRPEWVNIQALASNPEAQIDQYKFEELICDACVLWKSVEHSWDKGKAGTPTALHELILQNSNFVNPQAASLLVAKL